MIAVHIVLEEADQSARPKSHFTSAFPEHVISEPFDTPMDLQRRP